MENIAKNPASTLTPYNIIPQLASAILKYGAYKNSYGIWKEDEIILAPYRSFGEGRRLISAPEFTIKTTVVGGTTLECLQYFHVYHKRVSDEQVREFANQLGPNLSYHLDGRDGVAALENLAKLNFDPSIIGLQPYDVQSYTVFGIRDDKTQTHIRFSCIDELILTNVGELKGDMPTNIKIGSGLTNGDIDEMVKFYISLIEKKKI